MGIFGPTGFDGGFGGTGDAQDVRMQEARIALLRVLEFTRHSINDVINDPFARFRVLYFYKVDRFVDSYLKEKEREQFAKEEANARVLTL
ncbi:MAG TPA: hypothetical protein VMG59_05810 [Phycisphaerae bacterium]|nr:hypothetical protein [Phycisphaerae bacterium]